MYARRYGLFFENDMVVVSGYEGSEGSNAHKYAEEHGLKFELVG
uniref:Uncharacterized protein n=1 Tax=uncultured bacterium contig00107 TaxID=1181573 RepID=A0A806KSK2_9BACT|nr:hypothetical protein [uncultured bacterium contig00107]